MCHIRILWFLLGFQAQRRQSNMRSNMPGAIPWAWSQVDPNPIPALPVTGLTLRSFNEVATRRKP